MTWTLKELPLRGTARAVDDADKLAPTSRPTVRTSDEEMRRALSALLGRESRHRVYSELVARSEIDVSPRAGWLLLRLGEHRGESRAALARHLSISVADLCDRTSELVRVGYVKPAPDGAEVADELTPDGQSAYTRIFAAAHDRIERLLDDWRPEQHPRLRELVREITHELAASHERPDRDLDRVS